MIIEIKKCELDDRNIKAVIALSKEWEGCYRTRQLHNQAFKP